MIIACTILCCFSHYVLLTALISVLCFPVCFSLETTASAVSSAPTAAPSAAGRTNKLGAASAVFASKAAQKRDRSDSQFEQAQLLATFCKPEDKAATKADGKTASKGASSSSAGTDKSNTTATQQGANKANNGKGERVHASQLAVLQSTEQLVKNASMDPLTDSSASSGNSGVHQNGATAESAAVGTAAAAQNGNGKRNASTSAAAVTADSAAAAMSNVEQAALNLLPFKKRRKTGGESSSESLAGVELVKSDSTTAMDTVSIEVTGTRDTDSERESLCNSRNSAVIEDIGDKLEQAAPSGVGNNNDLFIF